MKLKPTETKGTLSGKTRRHPRFVLFLAVLPSYRLECIRLLREILGDDLQLFVSDSHLDSSVKTGIPRHYYRRLVIIRLFGRRVFLQLIPALAPLTADSTIVDLNPRSVSAWFLLIVRRIMRRRSLVWGHISPQAGPNSKTAMLRLIMRRLANGTVCYTYTDQLAAAVDLPSSEAFVAPNSLYKLCDITAPTEALGSKNEVIYVGRFAPAKKLKLLIQGFALASQKNCDIHLRLVGGGEDEPMLRDLVASLGIIDRVTFSGWIEGAPLLREAYSTSFCSVSPGFAGLGLTQSLGFGVPMLVADDEPHSPEIELADSGGVRWFTSDCPNSLADAIEKAWSCRFLVPDELLAKYVRSRYSAESMAIGLAKALKLDCSPDIPKLEDFLS